MHHNYSKVGWTMIRLFGARQNTVEILFMM